MPGASSPSGRAGAGKRWCARGDLLTVAVAAMLCSATYCFSIWHNGRNAADKIVIGPAPFVVAGAALCGGDAVELDFEAQHTAERAGLSLSSSSPTVTGRRALRAAAMPMDSTGRRGLVLAGNSDGRSEAADGKEWARVNVNGDQLRSTHAGAVRA